MDPVPVSLLVECINPLLPPITNTINSSLSFDFHSRLQWWDHSLKNDSRPKRFLKKKKRTIVRYQIYPSSPKSYERSSSNSSLHTWVIILCYPFNNHHISHLHSTKTALLQVGNDILLAFDSRNLFVLTFLDLRAVFDTVDDSTPRWNYGIFGTVPL